MNTNELRVMLQVLDALGENLRVLRYDDRSGDTTLVKAKLEPKVLADGEVVLITQYE